VSVFLLGGLAGGISILNLFLPSEGFCLLESGTLVSPPLLLLSFVAITYYSILGLIMGAGGGISIEAPINGLSPTDIGFSSLFSFSFAILRDIKVNKTD
jgi:hypothetical protein